MFKRSVIKLTILYSFLFFLLFWTFSLGLYFYLDRSFGKNYIANVKERAQNGNLGKPLRPFIEEDETLILKATEVTLENIREALLIINSILLFFIPVASFILAKQTLSPILTMLEKQNQFVSDASHELRTPLTIAASEIEVALQQKRSIPYHEKTLRTINGEIARLATLVRNLLILAQHDDTAFRTTMQELDIADPVGRAVASRRFFFKKNNISCKVKYPPESITMKGNSSLLEQLFTNLIDNAIKYSPSNTAITITIKNKNKQASVSVKDMGKGIPKEDQERIFDRFYRSNSSRWQTRGYGLGLSIAKTIAEIHNGNLTLHSAIGKGSTFTASFPLL
ncbi:HAMP domain-containing histidine kinase [Patescibacteria group bacterium]|nr:HAMP domain-containing histidine kinase [Patescibacteria group bacterium]MCL5798457.1 HAMP domain-containing histidine kinase [Patescibacteria group bacterium]